MDYEIVTLEKAKTIAGPCARTSNSAPDMGPTIGGLWQRLYGGLLPQIPGVVGASSYGLYTNYESDANGGYDVLAGFEVQGPEGMPEGVSCLTIPAGRYAKYSFVVNMQSGEMGEVWEDIWDADLDRAYTVDFEEYLPSEDMAKAPVNVYIALK